MYPPEEARRIIRKIRVHHTPKHGSWLNIAEIEISALSRECLKRRMPSQGMIRREIEVCVKSRNEKKATRAGAPLSNEARLKMKRLYL